MGLFSKNIATMDDLLLHDAENQIVKSLPKLIDKSSNRDLTKGLMISKKPGSRSAGLARPRRDERGAVPRA